MCCVCVNLFNDIVSASLDEAFRKHELLKCQKTALTAESGESDTEAEKRAADLIRQEAFKTAAKAFSNSIRKKSKFLYTL